jgi:hypothetical protein
MTNEKQQTAVDYYSKQIGKLTSDLVTGRISGKQFVILEIKLLEQAKEMQKEQIITAYQQGVTDEHGDTITFKTEGEDYYNTIFKS